MRDQMLLNMHLQIMKNKQQTAEEIRRYLDKQFFAIVRSGEVVLVDRYASSNCNQHKKTR